jgi:hypothetical protein
MGAELVRVPADRCKGGHIPFRLDVDQIQAQNLRNYRQLSVIPQCNTEKAGLRTSAFVYLLRSRLALHTTHVAFFRLLGHVYRPDAGACAHVENANFSVRWHRGLVQCVSPCYREHLVVDVHAVLFRLGVSVRIGLESPIPAWPAHLVARILVDASPVAVVVAAILEVIAVLSGHGQSAAWSVACFSCFFCSSRGPGGDAQGARCSLRGLSAGANAGREVARSGEEQEQEQEQGTHPFDAIVTIGAMLSSKQASWAGSVD